ncbi:MAG: hypothetical protein NTV52_12340 [Acidobacteria bacterium]|nr:hypothetical protein [Acidobacteriota bacterium]
MKRRSVLTGFVTTLGAWAREAEKTLRGKLLKGDLLETSSGPVKLTGDEPTLGVIRDPRVIGLELEVVGEARGAGALEIGPIHKRALYAIKSGQRLFVTYWCDICSIRTYTPGQCWCCQEQTELDLRERYD